MSSKVYDRFIRVFQKQEKVKMYLASGYCKYHGYDEGSMDVVEYHYNQHLGLLLIYELPDTVKQKVTEAEAYSTVWDIQMKLQHALPRSVVYYGQDTLKDGGTRYDELGVFSAAGTLCRPAGTPCGNCYQDRLRRVNAL